MEIEQVAEMARAVAALPQAEKDFFDGLVANEEQIPPPGKQNLVEAADRLRKLYEQTKRAEQADRYQAEVDRWRAKYETKNDNR